MASKPFTVDLNKPLVFQVGHLGEAYNEWVHQPIVSKEGPRFFGNDFLEMLTRTVWWVIPLVWLPVICWLVSVSLSRGLTPSDVASCLAGGVFIWTLLEYTLHRFLFHMETRSYWGNTLHYLLHGCHHKHPMDGLRLVFPPAATAILSVPESGVCQNVAFKCTAWMDWTTFSYILEGGNLKDWITIENWPQHHKFNPIKSTDFERWALS